MTIKILHIISGLNDGGAESILFKFLCNTESNINYVISLKGPGKYGKLIEKKGIKTFYLDCSINLSLISDFIFLIKLIKKIKPDIVQTWLYHADLFGGCAAYLANAQKIFWGIHHTSLDRKLNKKSTIYVAKINSILSYFIPTKIIVCAEKSKKEHIKNGFQKNKFIVIPNGIDLNEFKESKFHRDKYRKRLMIDQKELLLGTVARYNPNKDHLTLIKCIKKLKDSGIKFKYLFVGENMDYKNEELVRIIKKLKLDSTIKLIGQEKKISIIMNALDLHILSSLSEAFPLVILESMACRTPCVSTDVGDVNKIIIRKELLAEKGNYLSLFKAINYFINLKEIDKDKISRQLQIHIRENFSIKKMINSYLSVYNNYI